MNTLNITATPNGRGAPDVVCRLGEQTIHRDRIHPAKTDDRKKFAQAVCSIAPTITPKAVDNELLAIADKLDEAKQEKQAKPDFTAGQEIDVARIARPELIIRPELSAIAIPRIIDTPDGLSGGWLHYIRDDVGRNVVPLERDFLRLADKSKLYLHPMPAEPNRLDVVELGRWSASSRAKWLEGEPAPTTAEVLAMVCKRIDRFVSLPDRMKRGHGITLALWVMMTYTFRALPACAYLYLAGPLGSGKSRAMDVLGRMVWRPMAASSMTGPTLFRGKHATGGVLLLDEAERMGADSPEVAELRSMLLAGYRNGGQARRLEPVDDTYRMVTFDVYGPTVLGCIKGLPPALSSRCITLRMMRAPVGDVRAKRSLDDTPAVQQSVLDALHCWTLEHGHNAMTTELPDVGLGNRDLELWSPLLRIAAHTADKKLIEFVGEHARQSTADNAEDRAPDADPVFVLALYRLRTEGRFPEPAEVLERSRTIEPGWFDSWSARGLSGVLANYGIETSKRNGRRVYRAELEQIENAAQRYGFDLAGDDDE